MTYKFNNGGGLLSSVLLFKDATKIQNDPQRSTPILFVGAKTLNLKVGHYSNFTIRSFFEALLKFKMAAMDKLHHFLWAQKLKIEVCSNLHFTITLPTIWKCAGDFTEI